MNAAAEPPLFPAGPPLRTATAESRPSLGVGASLALHVLLLAAVLSFAIGQRPTPGERPVSVEILTPREFEAMTAPRRPAPEAATPPPPSVSRPSPERESAMIRPTEMLSAATLADPRSRRARALLAGVDDTERMIQLCGLEAMEQVHAWRDSLQPTAVVAYALAEVSISGDRVEADGAAFRSGASWYGLSFRCRLAPDHAAVVAFEFKVGAVVPEAQWESFNLPAYTGTASD